MDVEELEGEVGFPNQRFVIVILVLEVSVVTCRVLPFFCMFPWFELRFPLSLWRFSIL